MQREGDPVAAWARSGAMALTGRADGPALGPPGGLAERVWTLEDRLQGAFRQAGVPLELDALALLGERAAIAGLTRHGDRSCGGATRLFHAGDGWIALSLARPSDVELLAAWLGNGVEWGEDPWAGIAHAIADRTVEGLVDDGAPLGLPVAALPTGPLDGNAPPVNAHQYGTAAPLDIAHALVVDLSSLWAGPLCAQLLGMAGARIVKVESTQRPDGARGGPAAFFDLLHAEHESVAVDFTTAAGRDDLRALVEAADVVIEASRPRALQQLGIDAEAVLRDGRPHVWLSITGYGRTGEAAHRVAFGDDGAVAGGLAVWDEDGPCFCADAVADPLTGLVSAAAVLDALTGGGHWLIDSSLRSTAAYFAAEASDRVATPAGGIAVSPPQARAPRGTAAALGAHTDAVLAEVRRGRR